MPYRTEWVDPELALEHKGVKVYHTYHDDDVDQGPMGYWFTLWVDNEESSFDVRDLSTWEAAGEDVAIALIQAINSGELKAPDACI